MYSLGYWLMANASRICPMSGTVKSTRRTLDVILKSTPNLSEDPDARRMTCVVRVLRVRVRACVRACVVEASDQSSE